MSKFIADSYCDFPVFGMNGLLSYIKYLLLLTTGLMMATVVHAETLNVAVASNFVYTLKLLSTDFKINTGHELRISSASSGKLYAQIKHGAPYDVFLSADEKRADLLIKENKASAENAHFYALGKLVLLSHIKDEQGCMNVLSSTQLNHLAIANPAIAPYGMAAEQVLQKLGLWQRLQSRIVMGENIAQSFQFVFTRNAQAGFVAKSMLTMGREIDAACIWEVPAAMYLPIKQKMVLLNIAREKDSAQAFLRYMKSAQAKEIIKAAGYDVL